MGREATDEVDAMRAMLHMEYMKQSEGLERCSAAGGSQEGCGCSVSGAHPTLTLDLKRAKSIMMEREAAAKLGAMRALLLMDCMKLSEECKRCSAAHASQEGSGCSVSAAHVPSTADLAKRA